MNKSNNILKIFLFISFVLLINVGAKDIDLNKLIDKNSKTHTLIFFHMNYCPYCETMIKESFKNKKINSIIQNNFQFVDINISTNDTINYKEFKGSNHKFAKYLNINFYPTILFVNNSKDIIYKVKGYRDIKKFTNILQYISSNSYLDMSLGDFINLQEMNEE
jgi:thioredoxin-related protein